MGSNLRRLVKEYNGKKLVGGKGIGVKGRPMNAGTDAIENFYGRTICDNKGDVPKMSVEVWAILGHQSSAIEKPLNSD